MQIASRHVQPFLASALRSSIRRPAAFTPARSASILTARQAFYRSVSGFTSRKISARTGKFYLLLLSPSHTVDLYIFLLRWDTISHDLKLRLVHRSIASDDVSALWNDCNCRHILRLQSQGKQHSLYMSSPATHLNTRFPRCLPNFVRGTAICCRMRMGKPWIYPSTRARWCLL